MIDRYDIERRAAVLESKIEDAEQRLEAVDALLENVNDIDTKFEAVGSCSLDEIEEHYTVLETADAVLDGSL